jgi:hypothetical protein
MTDYMTPHSRRTECPSLASTRTLEIWRAQGKPDARTHPQPRVRGRKLKAHELDRYAETFRPSLREWFTAYNALSSVSGLFSHRPPGLLTRGLIPASGDQDHTSSPYALSSLVQRHQSVHRNPRSTSVTTRTPLRSRRDIRRQSYNSEKWKFNIFDADLETRELIEWAYEISFWAQAVLRPETARHAARLQPNSRLICPSGQTGAAACCTRQPSVKYCPGSAKEQATLREQEKCHFTEA